VGRSGPSSPDDLAVGAFDLAGLLRRIRRRADLSQRELARACQVTPSVIAHAEAGRRGMSAQLLATAAEVAGLRLAIVDPAGHEIDGMSDATVRDMANRRFPAHLDTRHSDQGWWHGAHRYDREQPWYTFDRDRWTRDGYRTRHGTPEDHLLPQPGDSPQERKAQRRRDARRRAEEERQRRVEAAGWQRWDGFVCTCPPLCDELDDWSGRPVHAEGCPCLCDLA
jgi:HTH-type transcriptional regulator/antitoxin HipB